MTTILSFIINSVGFLIIIGGLGVIMILERIYPDQRLKHVPGWWNRVLLINICQLLIVILGMYTWERAFHGNSIFNLGSYLISIFSENTWIAAAIGVLIAYLINTWIFYWWHLARH